MNVVIPFPQPEVRIAGTYTPPPEKPKEQAESK